MHTIIYAIVDIGVTDNKHAQDDALAQGKHVFDKVVHDSDTIFDYYTTFDDTSSNVSGPARWGEKPIAAPIDDEVGARMLYSGWSHTVREFNKNLDYIRERIGEMSNEQIMHDEDFIRCYMNRVGQYRGDSVYLYTDSRGSIRYRDKLDRVLDYDGNMWIVPADVHF